MSGRSDGGAASSIFRLTRSVDKVGRKTEMTRVIARLQFESRAFAGTAADQFNKPARAADTRHGERRRGQCRNAPARDGRGRLAEIGGLGLSAPTAQRNADRARAFGGELKATRGGHRQARDFCDHGAKPAMPQAFLATGEHRLFIAAFEIDDTVGLQANLRESWSKQVRPGDAPEDLALNAGRNSGREESGRCIIDRTIVAASDLMQRTEGEAPTRLVVSPLQRGQTAILLRRAYAGLRSAGPGRAEMQERTQAARSTIDLYG